MSRCPHDSLNVWVQLECLKPCQVNDDGRRSLQDGAHTVTILLKMCEEWEQKVNEGNSEDVDMWGKEIIKVFQEGLLCKVWDWSVDDVDFRVAFECIRHDEESNRVYYTSIYSKYHVVEKFVKRSRGGDHGEATSQLLAIYGQGRLCIFKSQKLPRVFSFQSTIIGSHSGYNSVPCGVLMSSQDQI